MPDHDPTRLVNLAAPDNSGCRDQRPNAEAASSLEETALLLSKALANLDAMKEDVVACHVSMALDMLIGSNGAGSGIIT